MKISLDVPSKVNLLNAIGNLDSYEAMTPGVENGPKSVKIPYKLGAARKSMVKNINVLKAALAEFEETRVSIFKEIFPEVAEGQSVSKDDKPEQFASYLAELNKVSAVKEEIELLPFPETVIFNDTNDFPAASVALLDELGLITYE